MTGSHYRWPKSRPCLWLTRALHVTGALVYGYTIVWQLTHPIFPTRNSAHSWGGLSKYLTEWNLGFHFLFFTLCVVCDIMEPSQVTGTRGKNRRIGNDDDRSLVTSLNSIRDTTFHGVVFPIGLFVATAFWSLFALDRRLIFPKELEPYLPMWLNHVIHTLIVPMAVVEGFVFNHSMTSKKRSLAALVTVGLSYLLWVLYIGIVRGFWVYPVLDVLPWSQRIGFIALCMGLMLGSFFVGDRLQSLMWPSKSRANKAKK